jgi:hypothetical protein
MCVASYTHACAAMYGNMHIANTNNYLPWIDVN